MLPLHLQILSVTRDSVPDISGPLGPQFHICKSETPPLLVASAWAQLALVCSAQAHITINIFTNSLRAHSIRTFLSMLLCHRQFCDAVEIAKLFPPFHWRRFVLLGLARRGSTPSVEARVGPHYRNGLSTSLHTHGWVGDLPATGLSRCWATWPARTLADTCNGFKILMRRVQMS